MFPTGSEVQLPPPNRRDLEADGVELTLLLDSTVLVSGIFEPIIKPTVEPAALRRLESCPPARTRAPGRVRSACGRNRRHLLSSGLSTRASGRL